MADVIPFKETKPLHKCSFCGKTQNQTKTFIRSDGGACICGECIAACKQKLEKSNG